MRPEKTPGVQPFSGSQIRVEVNHYGEPLDKSG